MSRTNASVVYLRARAPSAHCAHVRLCAPIFSSASRMCGYSTTAARGTESGASRPRPPGPRSPLGSLSSTRTRWRSPRARARLSRRRACCSAADSPPVAAAPGAVPLAPPWCAAAG
eukprot:1153915-Pleurochrysis_carterae.AAC.1